MVIDKPFLTKRNHYEIIVRGWTDRLMKFASNVLNIRWTDGRGENFSVSVYPR